MLILYYACRNHFWNNAYFLKRSSLEKKHLLVLRTGNDTIIMIFLEIFRFVAAKHSDINHVFVLLANLFDFRNSQQEHLSFVCFLNSQ